MLKILTNKQILITTSLLTKSHTLEIPIPTQDFPFNEIMEDVHPLRGLFNILKLLELSMCRRSPAVNYAC